MLRVNIRASISELTVLGTVGAVLIGFGGAAGGALPVSSDPWPTFGLPGPVGGTVVMIGVGLLVTAWLLMGLRLHAPGTTPRHMWLTLGVWTAPLILTAPLFSQDIYSYLAQGSITRLGIDPYSAGPRDLLGTWHPLARNVPDIWAHSPSPYGPVALSISAAISSATGDAVFAGVVAHRLVFLAGVVVAGWASVMLARRCGVSAQAALWLGVCNPLSVIHLIGGIHNEAIMLACVMLGLEVGLRGIDRLDSSSALGVGLLGTGGWGRIALSGVLISCGGLVKVTGFIGLGFLGMALARLVAQRGGMRPWLAIALAALVQAVVMAATAVALSLSTGVGFGWVTGQGGASEIRSWMSLTTQIGSITGALLGIFGFHLTDWTIGISRGLGLAVAGWFALRMLFDTFRGTMHPVGALGLSTLGLVILFPVVQPWYALWALLPLAAWTTDKRFTFAFAGYSAMMSVIVMPLGSSLPALTTAGIYLAAIAGYCAIAGAVWALRRGRDVVDAAEDSNTAALAALVP